MAPCNLTEQLLYLVEQQGSTVTGTLARPQQLVESPTVHFRTGTLIGTLQSDGAVTEPWLFRERFWVRPQQQVESATDISADAGIDLGTLQSDGAVTVDGGATTIVNDSALALQGTVALVATQVGSCWSYRCKSPQCSDL